LELRRLQEAFREAYGVRDNARGLYATFTWLVEELGEVAEALLSGNQSALKEEIADLVAWTLSIANMVGVDVEEAICSKYRLVLGEVCSQTKLARA